MTALLLALALAAEAADPAAPDKAPPAAIDAAPAPAALALPAPALVPPAAPATEATAFAPATPSLVSALPAASALAALGAVALLLSRRKSGGGRRRLLQVVETAHLGPKRQLVVARMNDQVLLLASSESGITLLSSRPASEVEEAAPAAAPAPAPADAEEGPVASVRGLWQRFRGGPALPQGPASFEALLQESSDDLELRRKLASGLSGRVA